MQNNTVKNGKAAVKISFPANFAGLESVEGRTNGDEGGKGQPVKNWSWYTFFQLDSG